MKARPSGTPRPGPARGRRGRAAPRPRLYRLLRRLLRWLRAVGRTLSAPRVGRQRQNDRAVFAAFLSRQRTLGFEVDLGETPTVDHLRNALYERGLAPAEGAWTFYLAPGPAVERCFPFLADYYPAGAGLKILKDMNPPDDAVYARHLLDPVAGAALLRRLTPSPKALVRVANVLHAAGLGPRVWDLVHLRSGEADLSAYVVQHVEGPRPDAAAHAAFMDRLRAVLQGGLITTMQADPEQAEDFAPPDCSGNLRIDAQTGRAIYVDFQAFMIPDEARLVSAIAESDRRATHVGRGRFFPGRGSLYQAIPGLEPGRRDVELRWQAAGELLRSADVAVAERLVFDVGCGTGLMLYQALAEGALWGFGWDLPGVSGAAERLLAALGATRVTLTGAAIDAHSDFLAAVPERFRPRNGGILLYLAVSDDIGFPDGVAALPWRYMLYEGRGAEGIGEQYQSLKQVPWLKDARLLGHRLTADGDGPARPLMLLERPFH